MVKTHREKHMYMIMFILAFATVASLSYAITMTQMYDNIIDKVMNWNGSLYELKEKIK